MTTALAMQTIIARVFTEHEGRTFSRALSDNAEAAAAACVEHQTALDLVRAIHREMKKAGIPTQPLGEWMKACGHDMKNMDKIY